MSYQLNPTFRQRLNANTVLHGAIVQLSGPESVAILSSLGFDWLWLDMEHTAHDISWLIHALDACAPECAPLVRIPDLSNLWIKKALDAGAAGIICPQVHSAQMAETLVAYCKYPQDAKFLSGKGLRSAGPLRAAGYGTRALQSTLAEANQSVCVLPQIESSEGVAAIDEILAVDGVDGVLLGPLDLSASLCVLGQMDHPRVLDALETVKRACKNAGKACGLYCANPAQQLKAFTEQGITLPVLGTDVGLLGSAAKAVLAQAHGALAL
ncbi:MAG: aldolase/citrate lyase family protein [Vampirovibrionales bacterium]|nr:aldolase/citrate lyase family protein [Vampirovibrionales bacterium]